MPQIVALQLIAGVWPVLPLAPDVDPLPLNGQVKTGRPIGLLMRVTYADGHFFHVRGDPKEIAAAK